MTDQNMFEGRGGLVKVGIIFLAILCVFFAIKTVNEVRSGEYVGRGVAPTNIITVSGHGEVFAIPDIAEFTFSVTEKGKLVADAQKKATDKMNKVIAYLKTAKIDDKDVQTVSYNIYPTYEYQQGLCTQYSCPPGKSVLTGYEVSQSVSVKVRDTSKAGDILSGIGQFEVQNLSGLNLTVDKQEELKREARQQAITKAQQDAKNLARDLGVRIVGIVNYSEGGNYPMPYYAKDMAYGMGGGNEASVQAPQIPRGENKITSDVTITYEIR